MESCQGELVNAVNTPKRSRDGDSVSPESLQKSKERAIEMLGINDEQFKTIMASLEGIKSSQQSMEAEMSLIRQENSNFKESMMAMNERVRKVEERIEAMSIVDEESVNELKLKLSALESQNNSLQQNQLNHNVTIRNLPKVVLEGREKVNAAMQNIFRDIQFDIQPQDYDAYAIESKKKDSAMINVKFESVKLKKNFMEKLRRSKRDTNEPHLLVEKIFAIPENHPLNGKKLTATNHLTPYNHQLLEYARKFSPSHFLYAFDNDDGIIKVKTGQGFVKITCKADVDKLVTTMEEEKGKKGKSKNNVPVSTRVTRNSASSNAAGQNK